MGNWNFLLNTTAGVSQTVTVNWEVPKAGIYYGWIDFTMPLDEAPVNGWSMGPGIGFPVIINAGGADFSRSTKEVEHQGIRAGQQD